MKKKSIKLNKFAIVAIIAVVVIAAGLAFYLLFFQPTKTAINSLKTQIEDQTVLNEALVAKNAEKEEMEEFLADDENKKSTIYSYNNRKAERYSLDEIFGDVSDYSVSFGTPTYASDKTSIKREMDLSFNAVNYPTAYNVLKKLNESEYRNQISNFTVSCGGAESGVLESSLNGTTSPASVSIAMYYVETDVDSEDDLSQVSNPYASSLADDEDYQSSDEASDDEDE